MKQLMKNEDFIIELCELVAKYTVCDASEILYIVGHTKNIDSALQVIYHCKVNNILVKDLTGEQIVLILIGNLEELMSKI